jgi:hypothetical protein
VVFANALETRDGSGFRAHSPFSLFFRSTAKLISYASIPKDQPGKGAGFAEYDLPEVRIHNHAGSGQAIGF